jgi:uncharacterized protein (TIGR03083 family)
MNTLSLAVDERADLIDLLRGLTQAQWDEPSILPGWSVKDIAAHVISYEALSLPAAFARILGGKAKREEPERPRS